MALSLRRRCQAFRDQLAAVGHAERLAEERHADLARQQEALRGRQQELDAKAAQLLQLEEEVNARLSSLGQELADFQERQDRAEGRLAQCQAEVEARLRNIHEREAAVRETEAGFALASAELQRLRAELETKQSELARREGEANGAGRPGADPSRVHVQPTATMLTKNEPAVDGSVTADALNHLHELERRGEELNHFARHLRRFRDQLAERERALALACERLEVLNPSRNLGPSGAP